MNVPRPTRRGRLSALLGVLAAPFVVAMALVKDGGDPIDENPFIVAARAAYAKRKEERDKLLAKVGEEKRADLTEEEDAEFRRLSAEMKTHQDRIAEVIETEAREAKAALMVKGLPGTSVRSEPLTYQRANRGVSYFRDLGLAFVGNDHEARARIDRHNVEMRVELPKRESRLDQEFEKGIRSLDFGERRTAYERRDISRTDGAGGEFVPPLWLLEEFAELARAGRPFANRVRRIPLPGGTDSINIPRITTGTAVAAQTADNAAVNEQDMVTNSVACPVRTIAGQQDIALQLLEQSPMMFDELVYQDLLGDYNAKLDLQLINGSGASGQLQGILGLSGTNAVTYTDATPTVPELYPKGADALNQVATNRLRAAEWFLMHPRRWYWMTAALDSQSRPLVVPTANGVYMAQAVSQDVVTEGPVGSWHGLAVVLDPNIPINLGAGTNEDRIVAGKMSDHVLFEGSIRTRALPEVLSGNLTVRLQLYCYAAWTAGRFPAATSIIAGTGLVTPTF